MQVLNSCPSCAHSQFNKFISCTDYTVTQEQFQIVTCAHCGLNFTNPRPSTDEIGKYYESEDYISHSNSKKGLFNALYQRVRLIALGNKLKLIKSYKANGNLLDIGCGTGEFLANMALNGYHVTGVEPSPKAAQLAIENHKLNVFPESELDNFTANNFDIITMWHVLEHVHELQPRLAQLHKLLHQSGILIIAVPNPESFDAQHYGAQWAGYDVPRHLYHFKPLALRQMFADAGFEAVNTRIMPFDAFYVSLLSEKYKTGNMNYFKGFYYGLRSYLTATSSPDKGSSQMYIFKKKTSNA